MNVECAYPPARTPQICMEYKIPTIALVPLQLDFLFFFLTDSSKENAFPAQLRFSIYRFHFGSRTHTCGFGYYRTIGSTTKPDQFAWFIDKTMEVSELYR